MIGHSAAKSGFIPGGDLSALIARLEAAEAGSRELDVALAWHQWVEPKLWGSTSAKGEPVWKVEREGKRVPLPSYTTSLDAALALAERLWTEPKVSVWRDRQSAPGWSASVSLGQPYQSVFAATPALALCIATLRAIPTEGVASPNLNPKAQGEVHD